MFLPHSVLNDNEFKQTVIGIQFKFTHIAKPAISNTGKFIKTINSENNITKCFTIKDLNSTFNDIGNPFSLFHLNINSFSFHFDELENLKSKWKNDFQIIGISEARLKITQETTTNIQLENFNIEHVPTGSAKGGVLLYIKKAINYKLRPDLTIYKKRELDSVFIEIFQEDSKNIVVGCIYRYIRLLVAVGLVWSHDPESYAGGSFGFWHVLPRNEGQRVGSRQIYDRIAGSSARVVFTTWCILDVSYWCFGENTAIVGRYCVHQLSNQQPKEISEEIRPVNEPVFVCDVCNIVSLMMDI